MSNIVGSLLESQCEDLLFICLYYWKFNIAQFEYITINFKEKTSSLKLYRPKINQLIKKVQFHSQQLGGLFVLMNTH